MMRIHAGPPRRDGSNCFADDVRPTCRDTLRRDPNGSPGGLSFLPGVAALPALLFRLRTFSPRMRNERFTRT